MRSKASSMTILEAHDIHVRFGDRVVLEEVSLSVEEGEFHGIMGPNGAGKTTFFNVLTGRVLVPDHDPVRRVHGPGECGGRIARVPRPRLRWPPRGRWRPRLHRERHGGADRSGPG